MNKPKTKSLSNISFELFKLLPLHFRYEIEANQRKDFTFLEKAIAQETLRKFLNEKFPPGRKNNVSSSTKSNCQQVGTLSSFDVTRVDDVIGKYTGESGEMVRRRRVVAQAYNDDPQKHQKLIDNITKGKTSLSYAYQSISRIINEKPSPPLPEGEFDIILMDFPWRYDLQLSGSPQYKTMTVDEGKLLKIPSAKNCILFMWVTNPKMEDAFSLVKHWGFMLKTEMIWIKTKNGKPDHSAMQLGIGHYVRNCHEQVWICTKGSPGIPVEMSRPPSVFFAKRTQHSVKPEIIYDVIEKMYPNAQRKLEMFARKKRTGNWTQWGDELV